MARCGDGGLLENCALLEIESPFAPQIGRLRLLEPAGSSAPELCARLLDGTYDKPFIFDCGPLRFLHFDFDHVQSLMRRDDPDALCLAYTRKMMAFLLFNPEPRRILLLGLGGGSIAKFCYRRLRSATITVLEIDPNVMALREEFHVPSDDGRFRVLQGDAVRYVAHGAQRKDVILVDACDRKGVAPALDDPHFYLNVKRRLACGGVFVMNLCGDESERAGHIARIRAVFSERVLTLPVREDGNLIVLAFRRDLRQRSWSQLKNEARALQGRYGLNFPGYVRKMASVARSTVGLS